METHRVETGCSSRVREVMELSAPRFNDYLAGRIFFCAPAIATLQTARKMVI
jgi:hypothetical protein